MQFTKTSKFINFLYPFFRFNIKTYINDELYVSGEDLVHTRGLGAWRPPHQGGGQGRDHGRRGGRGWGATQEEAQSRAHQALNKYSMLLLCLGRYTDKVISPNPIWIFFSGYF